MLPEQKKRIAGNRRSFRELSIMMKITESKAWEAAEWEYSALHTDILAPFFSGPISQDQIVSRLRNILRRCPQYYPAHIELGIRLLCRKRSSGAEQRIDRGFRLMMDLADPRHHAENMDGIIENLEKLWRFDISRRLLLMLADHQPLNADLLDSLAHAEARLGNLDAALLHIREAIKLASKDYGFWSNKGWYHLMRGELKDAEHALKKGLQNKPKDPTASGNLTILQYLRKHGGTYWNYLERPLDRAEIERLMDREDDQAMELCADFNDGRIEAFAQAALLKGGKYLSRLSDLLATLRTFFRFVAQIDSSGFFLNEDIGVISGNYRPIMHKFIFKHGDVDREMMEDVWESLQAYYGFLAGRGIVVAADFEILQKIIRETKNEFLDKMEQYNAIRHNDSLSEKKKEQIRQKLFGDDHCWPHF
jgi:tetratricopeptide (TPR) repeat protein